MIVCEATLGVMKGALNKMYYYYYFKKKLKGRRRRRSRNACLAELLVCTHRS